MKIGIDASRAFISQRTGIEEYSYQVIKRLVDKLEGHQVVLYVTKAQSAKLKTQNYSEKLKADNFIIPSDWEIKIINMPRLWTQVGLSLELLFHPVDTLFIPAHVVPIIHPKNTVVTIHGLEYEIFPECYSFFARIYMRWSIKMSCLWAKTVIAVSENTKKDLMRLYKVPKEKIKVIYEGILENYKFEILNLKSNLSDKILNYKPYILFVGRLEKRKNIEGVVEAFKILKEKYNIPHKLVLAGKPGFGYDNLKLKIKNSFQISNLKFQIIETGFISEEEKWQLLSNADIFLFPTFYEGFGLSVLEAQIAGVPVVASNNSSIPEIMGHDVETQNFASVLVDPNSPEFIAEAVYNLISNRELKDDIIKKGYENIKRFSWGDCSFKVSQVLKDKNER